MTLKRFCRKNKHSQAGQGTQDLVMSHKRLETPYGCMHPASSTMEFKRVDF